MRRRDGAGVVGPDVAVRSPRPDDAAAVAALQVRSWQAAYRRLLPAAFLDDLTEDSWLERWTGALADPPHDGVHQLVSTEPPDDLPRAVAVAGPAREPTPGATAELYLLYADPPAQGRGHGAALLREVHARLAADGHERALLWVAEGNTHSIGFYAHHGWQPDGTTRREQVSGATFDELRMVRGLTAT